MEFRSLVVSSTGKLFVGDGLERFILNFTTVGFDVEVNGASLRFGADTVAVSDTTQPFQRGYAPERGSIFVSLARELVEEAIPEPERLHGRPLSPAANALLVDHLRAMDRWSSTADASPSAHLGRATAHLLAACLDFSPETLERARPVIEAAQRRRARRHIDQHLASPDLTPDTLASALGMSRSKLFALFEPYGGVASYIQQRRLAAARRRLTNPGNDLRIADVAYATGFANSSHFSRAFRRAFGLSPSEFQENPSAASLPHPHGTSAPGWDFSRWVRELG
jgi:AraC-like DNA-binding protein